MMTHLPPSLAAQSFMSSLDKWRAYYDEAEPDQVKLPDHWQRALSHFQRIVVLRAIRPDRVPSAIVSYVMSELGSEYMESKPLDLSGCVKDSSPHTPLVFVLSKGSDPTKQFFNLAQSMRR